MAPAQSEAQAQGQAQTQHQGRQHCESACCWRLDDCWGMGGTVRRACMDVQYTTTLRRAQRVLGEEASMVHPEFQVPS
jgi:hypothetical protein